MVTVVPIEYPYKEAETKKGTFLNWLNTEEPDVELRFASPKLTKQLIKLEEDYLKNPNKFPKFDDSIWT